MYRVSRQFHRFLFPHWKFSISPSSFPSVPKSLIQEPCRTAASAHYATTQIAKEAIVVWHVVHLQPRIDIIGLQYTCREQMITVCGISSGYETSLGYGTPSGYGTVSCHEHV